MDKELLFMAFNPKTGTISGVSNDKFSVPTNIKLPQNELERFKAENDLQFNEQYQVYNFGGKNPVLLVTGCKFISKSGYGENNYSAKTWKWA